jgi:hypothetical protein
VCAIEGSGELSAGVDFGASLTGPGIAATESGFAIGYRSQVGNGLDLRFTWVSDAGVASSTQTFDVDGCGPALADGVSVAYGQGAGLLTASLPNCGQGAGAVFVPFADHGVTEQAMGPKNSAFGELRTSGRALAAAPAAGELDFVYGVSAPAPLLAQRVMLQGGLFKTSVPVEAPFDDAVVTDVLIAASDEVRALLAITGGAALFRVGPQAGNALDLGPTEPLGPATSGDIVAAGRRVATVVRSGKLAALRVSELMAGGAQTISEGPLPVTGTGATVLAAEGDRLFVAHGEPGKIVLQLISGLTGTPNVAGSSSTSFGPSAHPSIEGFDGSRVAIVAARGKVALTWLRPTTATAGAAGGWLIARCQ